MAQSNGFVLKITHLKGRPNEVHALDLLKKTVSLVKPIMRKHGWVLPELSEFFPDNPNLLGLNVNAGQKILIRLRPHNSPTWFLDMGDIIGTMLHELTHNVHGPHDEKFYKFLGELQKEYDELQQSGYAGEGFYSPGHRLGGSTTRVPIQAARSKAAEAAEKRNKVAQVLSGSRKLGGSIARPLTPREAAARAAERRLRDAKTCGSQQGTDVVQRESDKARKEGKTSDFIDLTMDGEDHWEPDWNSDDEVIIVKDVHPSGSNSSTGKGTSSETKVAIAGPSESAQSIRSKPRHAVKPKEWTCQACTLINAANVVQCAVCLMRRPPDETVGWTCFACGETGMDHQFWSCRTCGTIKVES
ncbi:WLM-domain-containing protein [Coprinopsis marcescibilis]|uniref:WLM-domain-containing protein n=1 Tax=Coprinopsis marcescibilis TaxID=230819 RepID=A0A5C3L1T7_COPMA|nr:WLM-domain-containing protein [Coprinopsis marcescibilis]